MFILQKCVQRWLLPMLMFVSLGFQANAQVTLNLTATGTGVNSFQYSGFIAGNPYYASCINNGATNITVSAINVYTPPGITVSGLNWQTQGDVSITPTANPYVVIVNSTSYNTGWVYLSFTTGSSSCGSFGQTFIAGFNKTFNANSFLTIVGQNCIQPNDKLITFSLNSPFNNNGLGSDRFYWSDIPGGFSKIYNSADFSSQTYSVTSGIVSTATSAFFNVTVGGCNGATPLTNKGFILNAPAPPAVITSGPACLPTTVTSFTIQVTNTAAGVNYLFSSNNDDWALAANTTTGFATVTNTLVRDAVKSTANIIVSASNSLCPTLLSSTILGYTPRQLTSADRFNQNGNTTIPGNVSPSTTFVGVGISNILDANMQWRFTSNNNWIIKSVTGASQTITLIAPSNANTTTLTAYSLNCPNGVLRQVIAVNPARPSTIMGIGNTLCRAVGSQFTLTCTNVPNAISYAWSLPAGWQGVAAGGNKYNVTVTSTATNGIISVAANGAGGFISIPAYTIAGAVMPVQPSPILGLESCVAPNASLSLNTTVPGTQICLWTLPLGWSATSANGNDNISIKTASTGSFTVSVQGTNVGCPNSAVTTLPVTIYPNIPPTISGLNCVAYGNSITYTTSTIPGATSYKWTLGDAQNWTFNYGDYGGNGFYTTTGNNISIGRGLGVYPVNTTLRVEAGSGCSNSGSTIRDVYYAPTQPSQILASPICLPLTAKTFQLNAIGSSGNQNYIWSLPVGWTYTPVIGSTNNNIIDVTSNGVPNTYVVSVQGSNSGCSPSAVLTTSYTINANVTPTITGVQKVLSSATVNTYVYTTTSIPGASSYNWTLQNFSNGWGFAGTNQPSLTTTTPMVTVTVVSATNQPNSNQLSVYGVECNNSGIGTFTMCFAPVTPGNITPSSTATTTLGCYFVGKSMPVNYTTDNSSASYVWGVYSISGTPISTWTVSGTTTSSITYDTDGKAGRYVISVQGVNACGTGNPVILPITVAGANIPLASQILYSFEPDLYGNGSNIPGEVLQASRNSTGGLLNGVSYNWYKSSDFIFSGNPLLLPVLGANPNNTYSVDVISSSNCITKLVYGGATNYSNARIDKTGNFRKEASTVVVSPNPTSTVINVDVLNNGSLYDISIANMLGIEVYKTSTTLATKTVNVSNWSAGTYIVTVTLNGEVFTNKVVVGK